MAKADRLESLRQLRELEQHTSAEQLAGALAEAARLEHALAEATARRAAARQGLERVESSAHALACAGTTAGALVVAAACARRWQQRLADAETEALRAEALAARGEQAVDGARHELAAALARRQVVERYRDRRALTERRLRERRDD